MKLFSGLPAGKVEVTPLPNLFFSELCPAIDDLAELKVTLHIFWLLAHRKGNAAVRVTLAELRADRTLMQSLAACDAEPGTALPRALAAATERGTLLHRAVEGDDLYFLNNETGRHAYERSERAEGTALGSATPEPAIAEERPNIFVLYEKSFGLLLTQSNAEELKDMEQEYTPEWVANALKETALQGKKSLKYTRSILERWKTEGHSDRKRKKSWYGDEQSKFIKR
jgi:DNA replication protein